MKDTTVNKYNIKIDPLNLKCLTTLSSNTSTYVTYSHNKI
jgi:hypothetical protein